MKKLPASLLLSLIFCFGVSAQANEAALCPKIEITGPSSLTAPGEEMIFTVMASETGADKLDYRWSVTEGAIIEGQGTPVVRVSTTGLSSAEIKATVEIKGLPDKCANSISKTASVGLICGLPIAVDEYAKFPFEEKKERLNNAALEWKEGQDAVIFFLIRYTKKDDLQKLKARITAIAKYFTGHHAISEDKYSFAFSESDRYYTTIYLARPEAGFQKLDWKKEISRLIRQRKTARRPPGEITTLIKVN
jgi:hypothetical protein